MNDIERHQLKTKVLFARVKLISVLGTCLRAKVGCAIVRHGRVIAEGYNGAPPGAPHCTEVGCAMDGDHCVRTIHAEANAIAFAARYGISTDGATLYTYGWRDGICGRCRKLAMSAGIEKIVEIPLDESPS